MNYSDLLYTAQQHNQSALMVGFAPELKRLPRSLQRYDDPLLPFGKAIIDATVDQVCGYIFHLAHYLAYGASGAIALERTIAYIPRPLIAVLHAPFASADYVKATYEDAFAAHAVTLTLSSAGSDALDLVAAYVQDPAHGVYIEQPALLPETDWQRLLTAYPGQIGSVEPYRAGHATLHLGRAGRTARATAGTAGRPDIPGKSAEPAELNKSGEPTAVQWYWQDDIYTTQDDDYPTAIHTAANRLRLASIQLLTTSPALSESKPTGSA